MREGKVGICMLLKVNMKERMENLTSPCRVFDMRTYRKP